MKRAGSERSIYECIGFLTAAVQGGALLLLAVVQVRSPLWMTFRFPLTF
jgi:hypothetical protein